MAESFESSTTADIDEQATDAVMEAVYQALSRTGYPELTMADIADQFEKSKGMLYYHYDGKEEILNDFFAYLCRRLERSLDEGASQEPHAELRSLIDRVLPPDIDDDQLRFRQAYFEIRSQAPYNRSYHNQIQRSDELLRGAIADCIQAGVESGAFNEVDPDTQADLILSTIHGTMERGVTLNDPELIARNRDALIDTIEQQLLAE